MPRSPHSLTDTPVAGPDLNETPRDADAAWQTVTRDFYERDPREVARDLIGRFLVHDTLDGRTFGKIVETEAYCGTEDRAAHVYGGRRTERTEVFWKSGGHAYVYLIYGMYDCFNVVTGPEDEPSAVLVRALEPIGGLDLMARRRGLTLDAASDQARMRERIKLTSGPGRLCQAMGIHRADHYGVDLTIAPLHITHGKPADPDHIAHSPRVNIDYAGEDAERPWRYFLQGSPFVSKP